MKKVGYFFIVVFLYPFALLPFVCLDVLAIIFRFFVFTIIGYRKNIILQNLRNSFPDKSDKEINHLAGKFYKSFTDIMVEYLAYWTMSTEKLKKHVKVNNPELLQNYYKENRHIIFVIGHFNNWEWYNILPTYTPHNVIGLVKPVKSKNFEKLITKIRHRHGMDVVLIKHTLKELFSRIKNNIYTLTIFAGDQIPTKNEINFWTTFLHQETPVFLGSEKIAKKINGVVIFAEMIRTKRHYYEVNMQVITDKPNDEPPYHITLKHIDALEKSILKQPEGWLWSHRRWKHKREQNEKVWERLP